MTSPSVAGYCTSAPNAPMLREVDRRVIADLDVDADRARRACARRRCVCGWQRSETKNVFFSSLTLELVREVHRLGGGGGLVEERRVGDRQTGEVDHHRLEVEERLEAALRDLGLVRRVLRVPARVLERCSAG